MTSGATATSCIFCEIAAGRIPARVVHEEAELVAFHDLNQQAPIHVLLIPRRHLASVAELGSADEALVGRLLVAAGTVVLEGTIVPPRSLVAGVPAKVRRELSDEEVAGLHGNSERYVERAAVYAAESASGEG